MSRLPIPGSDDSTWGDILNDYLSQSHNGDGTLKSSSIATAGGEQTANKGSANGYAPLDSTGKVPSANLPAATATPDASSSVKGVVQLGGDLAGTAASPTVPGLNSKVPASRQIISGTGLSGGGDLTADRTLTVNYGTTAITAAAGNDSRITGAEQTSRKDQANGYAGLDSGGLLKTAELPASVVTASQLPMVLAPAPSGGDDTPIIQAVIDALPSTGGTLAFRAGVYSFLGSLNFDNTNGIILQGAGGVGGGGGIGGTPVNPTVFVYNGGGARFISARGAYGFRMSYLQIYYTQSSFTGNLVDFDGTAGTSSVTVLMQLDNVALESGGVTPHTTATLLYLNNAVDGSFSNCKFAGGNIAIKGRSDMSHFSNAHTFNSCLFVFNQVSHIKDSGEAWTFVGCTFENLSDGTSGAYSHTAGVTGKGLSFLGCWFGDGFTSGGTMITWSGQNLSVIGGTMWVDANPSTAIKLDENNCVGVSIIGVPFGFDPASTATAIDFGSTSGHTRITLLGNSFESGMVELAGTIPPGMLSQNDTGLTFGDTKFGRYATNSLAVQASTDINLALRSAATNNPQLTFILQGTTTTPSAAIQVGDNTAFRVLNLQPNGGAVIVGNSTHGIGFNGAAQIVKPTVTGSKGGNAALASLITALASYGLITDSTT